MRLQQNMVLWGCKPHYLQLLSIINFQVIRQFLNSTVHFKEKDTMSLFCRSDELEEGACLEGNVDNTQVFIVRFNGQLSAYANICPHVGVPLNWKPNDFLDTDGELIQCSTHHALFLPHTGECISGPCFGESLRAFDISEKDGSIYVSRK